MPWQHLVTEFADIQNEMERMLLHIDKQIPIELKETTGVQFLILIRTQVQKVQKYRGIEVIR